MKGTLCAAKCKTDGKWYRAKVLHQIGRGQLQVLFIDYGNVDVIDMEDSSKLRKLPPNLLQFAPQAKRCSLAYTRVPRKAKNQGEEAHKYINKYGLNKVHDAVIVEERKNLLKVILIEEGESDWSTSINAFMLADGLAIIDQIVLNSDSTPEDVLCW